MELILDDLLKIRNDGFRNLEGLGKVSFPGVSTDSRTAGRGEVFVALKGAQFDGHRFLNEAFSRGVSLAVVEASSGVASELDRPLALVEDTTEALGQIANVYRSKFSLPIIAIGGSNGKTTTKEMIAETLKSDYKVLSTKGNLNNQIGVPQTIFRLTRKHEIAVVEIGTNHPGEIATLCRILEPTHGLVTTIGNEHMEFFRTMRGVAAEEGALFRYLRSRKGGKAIVNADDRNVVAKARGIRGSWKYGFDAPSVRVRGALVGVDQKGRASFRFRGKGAARSTEVQLRVPGRHNAVNALAAATTALCFDVRATKIREALSQFRSVSSRMEILEKGGVRILNDVYNANPDSTIAALRTLMEMKTSGKKIAVLADMRELGDSSRQSHALVGKEASKIGLDCLLTYGPNARHIHDAAEVRRKIHYEQKNMLAQYLFEILSKGDVVLVKGSRGMRMEDVVTFLTGRLSFTTGSLARTGT